MGAITPIITYDRAAQFFGHKHLDPRYYFFKEYYDKHKGPEVLLWEKDIFILPKKINGKYALIHRVLPGIQVVYFDKFEDLKDYHFWKDYLGHLSDNIVLEPKFEHEQWNIGGGAPFINLSEGLLSIYHAVNKTKSGKVYTAAAALFHKDIDLNLIGRLETPLFTPDQPWEKKGTVNNVVFPTGTAIFDNTLYIYYGAADSKICAASLRYHDLLEDLM